LNLLIVASLAFFLPTTHSLAESWHEMEEAVLQSESIVVPKRLRSKGFSIRAGNEIFELSADSDIKPNGDWSKPNDIELIDEDGRILDYQYAPLSQTVVEELFPQVFDVTVMAGVGVASRKDWRSLSLSGVRQVLGVEFGYRPSAVGYHLALVRLRDSGSDDDQAIVEYQSLQWRVGFGYERNLGFPIESRWRRLSAALKLGVAFNSHKLSVFRDSGEIKPLLTIIEQAKRVSENSRSTASYITMSLQNTLINNVWLLLDWTLMFDSFTFDEAQTAHRRPQQELKAHLRFSF